MTALDTLARQLNDAAGARRRRRRRRASSGLVLVAVVSAALVALLLVDHGGGGTPAADEREVVSAATPAYIAVDPDKIVYVRATAVHVDQRGERSTSVTEDWHRGRETHRLQRFTEEDGRELALDHVIGEDSVMHQINEAGDYRVIRPTDNEDAKNVIAQEQAGFLADFRRLMERGKLDASEGIEFAGRPAYRYHVAPTARTTPEPDQSYYIDRETGAPLGSTSVLKLGGERAMQFTQTVETIEVLEPTEENLAKLRTLTLQRRG